MTQLTSKFTLSACALAVSALLAACSGGGVEPPPDTVAPTLTITDSEDGDTATAAVTFTFTFSEDVGTSFVAEDILVTGGTAGTLTAVSETVYTLVVTPEAETTGTIEVSVAAAKYTDLALNPNEGASTASQAFDTVVVVPPEPAFISWDEAEGESPVSDIGAYGDASPTVEAAPTGGSGNALKISRSGAQNFGGTYFTVTPALPFTADNKTITARVYASRAGAVIKFKAEVPGDSSVEVAATEAVAAANTWQTLTWNLTSVNLAKSYTVIAISPDVDVNIGGAQSYWLDDITVTATGGGGGGGDLLTFSSGFSAGSRTAEGGEFGGFSGSNLDGFQCNGQPQNCGAGGTFSGDDSSGFYYYYQTTTPATALYAGIYVLAPGVVGGLSGSADTSGIQIDGQTALKYNFGQNAEWFATNTKNYMITLDFGKLYTVAGNACHLQLRRVVEPTSAAAADYAIDLSSFTVAQDCATGLSASAILAVSPISQVAFQAAGGTSALSDGTRTSGANLSVVNNGVYPTTLVVNGAITFE